MVAHLDSVSGGGDRKAQVLDAARRLLEDGGEFTMGAVAQSAGVTRQLLYLHFAGRAELLLALTRVLDEEVRPLAAQQRVEGAPTGVQALREAVALQGRIKPRIAAVAAALDRMRHDDADARAAWQEREASRWQRCHAVTSRLANEERLRDELDAVAAADIFWSMTSQRTWADLVERGWTTEQWVSYTTAVLERALLRPRRS